MSWWPLQCRDCHHQWELVLPPLPITADAFSRLLKAQSKCVRCDSPNVEIMVHEPEIGVHLAGPKSEAAE